METKAADQHAEKPRGFWVFFALFLGVLALEGCEITTNKAATRTGRRQRSSTDTSTSNPLLKTINVSWNANREASVNTTGGGYRVYFSTTNPVPIGTNFVTAAFSSGTLAPTTASIPNLAAGTYFIRIVAFSALSASGSTSTQISVVVP